MTMFGSGGRLLPRILIRVLPISICLLVGIWYVASAITERTVESEVRGALERDALQLATSIAVELQQLADAAQALAANGLIVNGLIDTQERQNYLPTFFQSLRIHGPQDAKISLTDYRGRAIARNRTAPSYLDASWIDRVMSGETVVQPSPQGLLIASAVLYEGEPEGAIIVEFDDSGLAEILAIGGQADGYFVIDRSGTVLFSSDPVLAAAGHPFEPDRISGWVQSSAAVPDHPETTILVAMSPEHALGPVDTVRRIALFALVSTILALTGGIVMATVLATSPLSRFAASIQRIGRTSDLSVTVRPSGAAEFQNLARAFNHMVERLRETTTSRDEVDNIVNTMGEMLIVTAPSGAIKTVNKATCTALEYRQEDLVGREITELFLDPSTEENIPALQPRIMAGPVPSIEALCVSWTGKTIPVLISATPLWSGDGARSGAVYLALDISEKKKTEQALARVENRLSVAIEAVSDAFALYDENDRLALCNSKYRQIYAASAHAIRQGNTFEEIIRAGVAQGQYAEAIGREEAFIRERVGLHRNPPNKPIEQELGDGRWLQIHERRTEDGGIVGIRTDITKLKNREAELRQQAVELASANSELGKEIERREATELSLRESESRARAVFETAADGVVTIDEAGIIESVNPAAEKMFGYAASELEGQSVGRLLPLRRGSQLDRLLPRYLRTASGRLVGNTHELNVRAKGGAEFPVELTVSEVYVDASCLFTGIVRDITERKRIDRIKDEFISTVSHELRTPMASIVGALGLINGGAAGVLPKKAQSMIEIAFRNCNRLVRLLNDILDLERIGSGQARFDFKPLNLEPLVEDAIETNAEFARRSEVRVRLIESDSDARVVADEDRLIQVLTNLLSNAVKFSHKGGSVDLRILRHGEQVRVTVSDQGPGISASFRERAFERFSQADGSDRRQKGGSGLGLNICKLIVEAHDGTIDFDTVVGKGTTFYFDLPAAAVPDGSHPPVAASAA